MTPAAQAARPTPMRAGMIIMFLDGLGLGAVMPILPFWVLDRGGSALAVTQLLGLYALGAMIAAPIGGRLADRIGRVPVTAGSLGISVLVYLAMAGAGTIVQMILLRAVAGALTCRTPVIRTYLTDLAPGESHAAIIGSLSAAYTIGVALGPLGPTLVAVMSSSAAIGYSEVFIAAALLTAAATALAALSWPRARESAPTSSQPRRLDRKSMRNYRVPSCLLSAFGSSFAYAVLISTTALATFDRFGWGSVHMGWLLAGAAMMIAVARFLVMPMLARRIGNWNALALSLLGASAALVLMGSAKDPTLFIAAFAALSLATGVATLLPATLLSINVTGAERGYVQGLVYGVSTLSTFVATLVSGLLYQYVSAFSAFAAAAALSLATALLARHEGTLAGVLAAPSQSAA